MAGAQGFNFAGRAHNTSGHFYHDQEVYEDCLFYLDRAKLTGGNNPTWSNVAALGNYWAWSFSASATNELTGTMQVSHRIKKGSLLYPHIHWFPLDANAGNVRIKLDYSIANIGSAFPVMSTESKTFAADGVAYGHQIDYFTAVTHTEDILPSAIIKIYIARLGGDGADTYGSVIYIEAADWHIIEDTQGTFSELSTDK